MTSIPREYNCFSSDQTNEPNLTVAEWERMMNFNEQSMISQSPTIARICLGRNSYKMCTVTVLTGIRVIHSTI